MSVSIHSLKAHYVNVFPFEIIHGLFGDPNREFCYVSEDGIWTRKRHFNNLVQFEERIITLLPPTLHIGAIYDDIEQKNCGVVSRELVFDLDLPDYGSEIRTCCGSERPACDKCWQLAQFSIRVLNYVLSEILGYSKFCFFYSGMKGFHCWVFDEECKNLDSNTRSGILEFFSIKNITSTNPIMDYIWKNFALPYYKKVLLEDLKLGDLLNKKKLEFNSERAAILYCLWPRWDGGVTSQIKHTAKSPFCLHSVSGKIAYFLGCEGKENPFRDYERLDIKENILDFYRHVYSFTENKDE
jgi:DNA primase small subunit